MRSTKKFSALVKEQHPPVIAYSGLKAVYIVNWRHLMNRVLI